MLIGLAELVSRIRPGCALAIASDFNGHYSGAAMAVTRELVRRRITGLRIIAVPTCGIQADLLIGAGCVAEIECGAMIHSDFGAPPRFLRAFGQGTIRVRESSCPAIFHGLTAASKGAPFMCVRGLLGSDLVALRDDWAVITNPFDPQERVVVVPAIHPDVALFHAPCADRFGNVWVGRRREMILMAHASRQTLVTVDRLVETDLMRDPDKATGTLSAFYVDAIAESPGGSWPLAGSSGFAEDAAHLDAYLEAARSDEGFEAYLARHVYGRSEIGA